MTPSRRQRTLGLTALLAHAFTAAGCESDEPVRCRYVGQTALVENAATQVPGATLIAAADGFVLAGLDGTNVHWAPLAKTGTVGAASSFTIAEPTVIAPQLAVTSRVTPGDQLVAIYGTATAENAILIRAVTQVAGEPAAAPITLATLPAGLNLADLRVAVGSSKTGSRALMAYGLMNDPAKPIEVHVLGANAAIVGAPLVAPQEEAWRCLQFVPSRTDWALSWLRSPPGGKHRLAVHEGQDAAVVLVRHQAGLDAAGITCPVLAPKEAGYLVAFQNMSGTFIADYDSQSSAVSAEFVAPAVQFGTPDQQPPIGGVAGMGLDAAVLFGVSRGPQVWLYDPFGARVGQDLKLPANIGDIGHVSSWPVADGLYTTYREGVSAPAATAGPRWFMRIECPRT